MRCPRCNNDSSHSEIQCSTCNFELRQLHDLFGRKTVQLERVTDSAHCLRLRDGRDIEALLEEFERTFPQVFVSLYIGVLPTGLKSAEVAFWFLNTAALGTSDYRRLNEYAIVLVLDPVTKSFAVSVGYGLEQALPQKSLEKIMQSLRTQFWHGEHARAIKGCISQLGKRIRQGAKGVKKEEDIIPPQSAEDFLDDSGLGLVRSQPRRNMRDVEAPSGPEAQPSEGSTE